MPRAPCVGTTKQVKLCLCANLGLVENKKHWMKVQHPLVCATVEPCITLQSNTGTGDLSLLKHQTHVPSIEPESSLV